MSGQGTTLRESELFQQYSKAFQATCRSIRGKVSLSGVSAAGRRPQAAEVEGLIAKADVLVRNMELEARSHPAAGATQLLTEVEAFKTELRQLKDETKRIMAAASGSSLAAARTELGLGQAAGSDVQQHKAALATQQLEQSTRQLREARATLGESEATGAAILQELQRQRGVIEHSKQTLDEANGSLDSAGGSLKAMLRRTRWFW